LHNGSSPCAVAGPKTACWRPFPPFLTAAKSDPEPRRKERTSRGACVREGSRFSPGGVHISRTEREKALPGWGRVTYIDFHCLRVAAGPAFLKRSRPKKRAAGAALKAFSRETGL
jgi:hypothetical protein